MTQQEIDKRMLLIEYAQKFQTPYFVETGTYKGDTVKAMLQSGLFRQIHTIDIYQDRAEAAARRYKPFPHVHCWFGDSAEQLPAIIRKLDGPVLYWLDAHHSGKQIARTKGLIETPIVAELDAVLKHPHIEDSVIVIDDSRYFVKFPKKYKNYPTTQQVKDKILGVLPDWVFEDKDDIIRCHRAEDQ